jgi:hypothetical protein
MAVATSVGVLVDLLDDHGGGDVLKFLVDLFADGVQATPAVGADLLLGAELVADDFPGKIGETLLAWARLLALMGFDGLPLGLLGLGVDLGIIEEPLQDLGRKLLAAGAEEASLGQVQLLAQELHFGLQEVDALL